MAISIRGEGDDTINRIAHALTGYHDQHPKADIEIRRQNSVAIYIRVVDPDFVAIGRAKRHDLLWHFIEELPEDDQSQVSLLLALSPEETDRSFANFEFDLPRLSPL